MYDAIILSDLHLGSAVCQTDALSSFLDSLLIGDRSSERLILNGDVFDSFNLARMRSGHWDILHQLRELAEQMEVIWIAGNHDGPPKLVSRLLGVPVAGEYVFHSGGVRVLALHGDRFDTFIARYPRLTDLADRGYRMLQRLDPSHTLARFAKHRSKTFLRCAQRLAEDAVAYARKRDCDVVCCGHTHLAGTTSPSAGCKHGVRYFNSGCWTERTCHFLTVRRGEIAIQEYVSAVDSVVVTSAAAPATALT